MKRLEINFVGHGARSPWPGRVLIALALAASLNAGVSFTRAHTALERLEAQVSAPRNVAVRKPAPEELAAARETVERLALPWAQLFDALESAANEDVTLVAMEPDPRAGTVLISGDSRDYLSALRYTVDLARAGGLERVALVRHESRADAGRPSVSFAVSAGWNGGKQP